MSYIKFLGIGGASSNPMRKSPSILVVSNNSKYAILDFSAFTYCSAAKLGFENIDLIYISHRHADHFGGILNFIHSLEIDSIPRLNKSPIHKEKFTILGFSDIYKWLLQLTSVGFTKFPNWQPIPIKILNFPKWQKFRWNEFIFVGIKVKHTTSKENIMLKLTNTITNVSFVYTGDIKPCKDTFDKLVKFSKDTQSIIGDLSTPLAELNRDPKTLTHPDVRFWGKFLKKYKGHIYFVHTYGVDSPALLKRYILKYANLPENAPEIKRLHFPKVGEKIII